MPCSQLTCFLWLLTPPFLLDLTCRLILSGLSLIKYRDFPGLCLGPLLFSFRMLPLMTYLSQGFKVPCTSMTLKSKMLTYRCVSPTVDEQLHQVFFSPPPQFLVFLQFEMLKLHNLRTTQNIIMSLILCLVQIKWPVPIC